jgi:hypothetical protein
LIFESLRGEGGTRGGLVGDPFGLRIQTNTEAVTKLNARTRLIAGANLRVAED